MNITDWLTLMGILVALSLGVYGILQTKRIHQEKQYRYMRLKEILEWALGVQEWIAFANTPNLIKSSANFLSRLEALRGRGKYIIRISDFNSNLQSVVGQVKDSLNENGACKTAVERAIEEATKIKTRDIR